jgi:hypothetical protein
MSDVIREGAQWRRVKTPIMIKYSTDHQTLLSEVAGRGFSNLPGYAYDLENSLEMFVKQSLSDANVKILTETIERELKQTGFDYDQNYRDAVIVWELNKQSLMSAWESEYAGIKQGMELSEEVLNQLQIEVNRRAEILLSQKTAIELEAEGYKQELESLDALTAPYNVQLANARLLTAQRKLTIIPILQEIIVQEQALLVIETRKAAAYALNMAAEMALATKREELLPFVNDLASKTTTLSDMIVSDQIPKENLIANEKVRQAQLAVEIAQHRVDELEAEIATETTNLDLIRAKRDLQIAQFNASQTLLTSDNDLTKEIQDLQQTKFDFLNVKESETAARLRDYKEEEHDLKNLIKVNSALTSTNGEVSAATGLSTYEIDKINRVTDLQVAKEITAALTHLIG